MTSPLLSAALDAHRAGRLDEAELSYRAVLAADPNDADALHLLGLLRDRAGARDEGERLIRAAIAIRDEAVFNMNLGTMLLADGRPGEAEAAYRRALALRPDLRDAAGRLAALLLGGGGRDAEAARVLDETLRHGSRSPEILNMLGVARMRGGDAEGAEWAFLEVLELAPGQVDARFNLGLLYSGRGRLAEAEAAFRAVLAAAPDHAEAQHELAGVLIAARRLDEARARCDAALALRPHHAAARFNLGLLQVEAGEMEEAEASFRGVLAHHPDHARAQLALGTLLLGRGAFAEGWPLHEARSAAGATRGGFTAAPDVPYPRWAGEDLAGRAILVWAEQGFGDAIQFVRFATELKRRGAARVTLATFPALARLFANVAGVDRIVTEIADPGPHDYWTYPLSIPLHLGTTIDTIPAALPYLKADPALVERWASRLPEGGFRVGLVWRGSPTQDNDARRSLPGLATLEPLWSVPGISFVSLQKGEGEADARAWAEAGRLTDLGPQLLDFSDTAAVVDRLDLVISVCTSVAHLAGALGTPCWILLPAKGADWRWLQDREDSPWYPGAVRLFRHGTGEGWDAVVARVAAALETFARR
jgi:tetratricopeptide (TPR) repeat protein